MTDMVANDGPEGLESESELETRIRVAIEGQPADPEALHSLGLELAEVGRSEDALDLISRAIELSPKSKVFVQSAAKILAAEGMFQQAALAYMRAQEIDANDPQILMDLASVLRRGNKEDEAMAVLARAEELTRSLQSASGRRLPSIIVASAGYCGASSLVAALETHGFQKAPSFLSRFSDLRPDAGGIVYETHALPPTTLPDGFKVIFLFGNPVITVLSTYGEVLRAGRILGSEVHTSAGRVESQALLHGDSLGLVEHFERWFRYHPFPVLAARYPDVFKKEYTLAVEQFLQTEFSVESYEQRTISKDDRNAISLGKIFKELASRIETARPISVLGGIPGEAASA